MAVASRRGSSDEISQNRSSIKSVATSTVTYTSDDCIRKLDLFCKCDAKFMDEVIACFDVAVFSPGAVLLEEGMENSNFWVVHRGSVEVLEKGQCIRQLEDGDSYGEAEFLGVRRKARETLRASTFVDMRVLSREALIQVLAHHPYERAVLSHLAISRKLEARRCQLPRSDRVDDANAWKEKLRDLEEQQAKLAQVLRSGRKHARGSLEFDRIPVRAILGGKQRRRSNRGSDGRNVWKPARRSPTRHVVVEEMSPGCWHTLNDWHRQLAASPEGHRLNLWQLDKYRGSTTTPSSASRTSRMASTMCSSARPHSRCAEHQSLVSTLPPRPHSVASTIPSSTMVLQPPYPQVPQSPMRDPACLNRGCRRSVPKTISGATGQSCTSGSCKRPLSMQSNHQDGGADITSFDEATSSWQEMLASTAVPIPSTALPPGLAEAVGELSRGFLRSKWHCENLARIQSPWRREAAARSRGNDLAKPSSRLLPDPARSRPSVSIASNSVEKSIEETHNRTSIVAPSRAARAPSTGVAPMQREKVGRLEGCPGSFRPPSSSPIPMVRKQLVPAQRRLEMTLRGNFKSDLFEIGGGDLDDALTEDTNMDDPDEAVIAAARRALSSTSCFSDPEVAAVPQRLRTEMDMDSLRARMGFGRDEGGATPSGRSSVPACHRNIHGGALSAPPLHNPAVDEGIELSSLEQNLEHHVFRILERSLRGPSRATSCEPQESFRGSPSPSPTPTQQVISSPRSSCPSPSPRGLVEELNLGVHLRLCQSRCGSSSAVLELVFDHCKDCSEVCGCVCYPTPDEAEARLLAYFARHTLLRLAATQLPVRVLLEPLDGDEDHDDGRVSA